MSFPTRIRTVYRQELIAILRDRRTLIAMIVVPIVLYPLLMLGSIQAVTMQAQSLVREAILIGVASEAHRLMLSQLILDDKAAIERERDLRRSESRDDADLPISLDNARIRVVDSHAELEQLIRIREIQIGVVFESDRLVGVEEYDRRLRVTLPVDLEEVRSRTAKERLDALLRRTDDRVTGLRLQHERLPPTFMDLFDVSVVDLSAPPSILGQVLPLVLVLMTITGAIYPAIDLTAGERERGTLESLMVCPVPVLDLIVGKFLVVTTVAIMGAALNLGSVAATVHFGGFDKVIASTGGGIPIGKMLFILVCLVPFAVLMSAIMIAVCSYARTFKEAQNYVTPVILAVLIPGGIAALPATKLQGVMLVMPVGNMVLLARDLLLGAVVPLWQVVMVLLSTTLYAGAAVAVAANVFGHESVVFADAVSLSQALRRERIKPKPAPPAAMGLLFVALLFPTWFFVQSALSSADEQSAADLLSATGWLMPTLFVALPWFLLWYGRVDIPGSLYLRVPALRHLAAGALLGLTLWIPAYELQLFQQYLLGTPQMVVESAKALSEAMRMLPLGNVIVLIALIPAVCEELLFRGFLLSSLGASGHKWTAILASAVVFGTFHFLIFKFPVTAALGVVLGILCWQSGSIWPSVAAHFLHNLMAAISVIQPELFVRLGVPDQGGGQLPVSLLVIGGAGLILSLRLARSDRQPPGVPPAPEPGEVASVA